MIEKEAGMTITQMFETFGEPYFRDKETELCRRLSKQTGLVISTGGGWVTRRENLPLLQQNGTVIWLKRSIDQLSKKGRPLSQANDLQQMYEIRKPLFKQFSHYEVECGATPHETTGKIIALLDQEVFG